MSEVFSPRCPSRAATALVALLVTSLAATPAFPDGVGTRQITDTFSGNTIDPRIWWAGGNRPDAVAVSQAEGHLTVSVSGRAGNDFNAGVGTLCRAHGDFDARISFELSAWPALDGVQVALMAFGDGASLVGNVYRASASWGDSYGAWYPQSGGTSVDGYHIFVGGGFGKNQAVGRQIFTGVSAPELPGTLEKVLRAYLKHRAGKETFQQFSTRHEVGRLQEMFAE